MNYLTNCRKRCQRSGTPEEAIARDYAPTERSLSPHQSPTLGSSNGLEVEHASCQADGWERLPTRSWRTPPGPRLPGAEVCVCVCVRATGPPRKPRPLLEITGPERMEERPSHPSQEKNSGSQEAAQNQSEEFRSLGNTTRIPRTSEPELSPTFLAFPVPGRGAELRFQGKCTQKLVTS